MLETQKKKLLILPLVLALLVCSLAVPVSAVGDHLSTFNFSATDMESSSAFPSGSEFRSVLYNAYFTDSAVLTNCNGLYIRGFHWDEYGRLCLGVWSNWLGSANASVLGVFPESNLDLLYSAPCFGNYASRYMFLSQNLAQQFPDYLTTGLYVMSWDDWGDTGVWYAYFKASSSTIPASSVSNVSLMLPAVPTKYDNWYAAKTESIMWGVVPEGGTTHGSAVVDPDTQPYIAVVAPSSVQQGLFVGVRASLVNRGDIDGAVVCLLSGQNSARTTLTQVSGSDSGEFVWNVNCGADENTSNLTLTFMVEGRPDIRTVYKLPVIASGGGNEGSSGDLRPTEPGGDSGDDPTISDLDKEKDEAQSSGNDLIDDLEQIIPDHSEDISAALGSLVTALAYDGTEAVLIVPQWTFPQVGDLIPEHVMWERMEVDMGEYINMLPADLLLLVQSLLTAALIMYCFYELYATVGLILMPKGGAE